MVLVGNHIRHIRFGFDNGSTLAPTSPSASHCLRRDVHRQVARYLNRVVIALVKAKLLVGRCEQRSSNNSSSRYLAKTWVRKCVLRTPIPCHNHSRPLIPADVTRLTFTCQVKVFPLSVDYLSPGLTNRRFAGRFHGWGLPHTRTAPAFARAEDCVRCQWGSKLQWR
jgi:hypothetical protein